MLIIKNILKKNSMIRNIFVTLENKLVPVLVRISPVLATKYIYIRATDKKLNLKSPKDFNEKLQWLKLYWKNSLVVKCSDKYEVREYVKECGCEEILNILYGVYNSTKEIEWESLPHQFVLKTTNGCGTNIICEDKNNLNQNKVFNKLKDWMKIDYGLRYAEIHYSKMTPRIICEKYIETKAGLLPNDYKIYCFNGQPKLILVVTERAKKMKLSFLDLKWKKMNIGYGEYNSNEIPKKPNSLDAMIEYSRKLSKPFPFVRIDFYDYNDRPILGEMTFTPAGCVAGYYNEFGLNLLGEMLSLPKLHINTTTNKDEF